MNLSPFALEGLLRIVRLLEELPDESFDLVTWRSQYSCGTTYCAMGLAATQPWFQEHGLGLHHNFLVYWPASGAVAPGFNFDAVAAFFRMTQHQAKYLFRPSNGYFSRQHVIYRIRKFVARDGAIRGPVMSAEENARIDEMLAALDARLALENAGDPAAFMAKVMAKGDQLVPCTA